MKKYFEGNEALQDVRQAVLRIQKNQDRRGFYIFIGVITAIVVSTIIGVVMVLNKKKYDDYDEDWDCDWDDYEEDDDCCFDCEDDCCCTDKDVDTSVKVEQI